MTEKVIAFSLAVIMAYVHESLYPEMPQWSFSLFLMVSFIYMYLIIKPKE